MSGLVACDGSQHGVPPSTDNDAVRAFVGSNACAGCHESQAEAWRGSHHDLAMQVADQGSVLRDFSDATFEYFGTVTRGVTDTWWSGLRPDPQP